jgi:CheY-like chemotaxis protein
MVSTELIRAVAQLISSLFWPLIVVFIILYFGPPIKRFLQQSKEATVGGMGFEATFRRDIESALLYGLSVGDESDISGELTKEQIEDIMSEFRTYVEPETQDKFSQASLLWVDDSPDNNTSERETLESLGIDIDLSKSTSEAVKKIKNTQYDVIISDMGRPESDRAGYDLLERKQKIGDTTPFIIYSYPVEEEHKQMAKERGAFGSTDSPRELFSMVRRALGGTIESVQYFMEAEERVHGHTRRSDDIDEK